MPIPAQQEMIYAHAGASAALSEFQRTLETARSIADVREWCRLARRDGGLSQLTAMAAKSVDAQHPVVMLREIAEEIRQADPPVGKLTSSMAIMNIVSKLGLP